VQELRGRVFIFIDALSREVNTSTLGNTYVTIEQIVLLDFIHRLVSQKTNKIEELKI
jgi:hypothetical protein